MADDEPRAADDAGADPPSVDPMIVDRTTRSPLARKGENNVLAARPVILLNAREGVDR